MFKSLCSPRVQADLMLKNRLLLSVLERVVIYFVIHFLNSLMNRNRYLFFITM